MEMTGLRTSRIVLLTFQTIQQNGVTLFILAVVLAIPTAAYRYEELSFPETTIFTDLRTASTFIISMLSSYLVTAIASRAVVPGSAGQRLGLVASFLAVGRDLLPLTAIAVFSGALITLGSALFLLPGLILNVFLFVVMPVRIIERRGVIRTLIRSVKLTRGNRWPVFGLITGLTAFAIAAEILVNVVVGDTPLAGIGDGPRTGGVEAGVALTLADLALSLLAATVTVVLYSELRQIQDGPAPTEIAAEFD